MQIGLMIEGQHGLNWPRWQRILELAESAGYQCVFRSDHFTNPAPPDMDSLELFTSLTFAATHTRRIEFGSLVAPVTFRAPLMTLRQAVQIDALSGGRLVLGLGAGWQQREHDNYGLAFDTFPMRFDRLTDALEIGARLLADAAPVTYAGKQLAVKDAVLLPRPQRRLPILIGGNGPKRTLPLAARYADEWNGVFITPAVFAERSRQLDGLAQQLGRAPETIKRSLMTAVCWGADNAALATALTAVGKRFGAGNPSAEQARGFGMLAGTSSALVDQLGAYAEAGCQRVMLQITEYDDLSPVEAWARDVLPQVAD